MKTKFLFGLTTLVCATTAYSQITINEVDSDSTGTDTLEFVELYNAGAASVDLTGYVLVFFDGGDSGVEDDPETPEDESEAPNRHYFALDLTGQTIASEGFLLVGNTAVSPAPALTFGNNGLQNGADAVALYNGVTGAAYLSAENEDPRNPEPPVQTDLLDAVVYDTNDGDDIELLSALGVSEQFNENESGNGETNSIQRNPDGSGTFIISDPTPGSTNFQLPRLTLSLDPDSISEGDGSEASFGTVVLPDVSVGELEVTISSSDNTAATVPLTVTIDDGNDFGEFPIDAVDDVLVDGVQSTTITVSAPGYQDATATLLVADDDLVVPDVVINEMQVKAFGSDPQFVELFNNDSTSVDISRWSVKAFESDNGEANFGNELASVTIPASTILNSGEFYLIGDAVFESIYGITPDLQAEPGFGQFDITMILFDDSDNPVFTVLNASDAPSSVANNAGQAVVPDITTTDGNFSAAGFYLEPDGGSSAINLEFMPQPASSATPGSTNGTPLVRLRVAVDVTFFSEAAGAGVAEATITRVNNTSGPLTVTLASGDTSEVVFQVATLEFADGDESLTVLLDAVDDGAMDDTQTVVLTATAPGFIDGTATVSVSDDEAVSGGSDILLTQYYEDSSFNKHVEISNVGAVGLSLDGWSLTLWANAGTEDWKTGSSPRSTFALDGITIPAGGSIVISSGRATVPSGITSIVSGVANHNGDDSLVLYNGAINPGNVVDALSFTDAGNEGEDTSFVRANLEQGYNLDPGSNITDFPTVWLEVDNATVEAAMTGDTNYLGFFAITEPSDYTVTIDSVSGGGANPFVINFTATGTSDVYVSTDLQSWALANGGEDVAISPYTDPTPPAGKAFYLIQEADAPAPR